MTVLLNDELTSFLRLQRLPARLTAAQVAAILGFQPHDIPILTANKLLRPLGRPQENHSKYYAAREMEALKDDVEWLNKATRALTEHWKAKNSRKYREGVVVGSRHESQSRS